MEITQIICPACGGSITVDENGGAKCDYCGAMLNLDYMQDSHKDEIDALTDRIYDLIAEKRYIEAEEATKEGLKKIPYAGRLHLCLLMCELNVNHPQQLATVERNYLSSTNYRNCIKYMTTTDKADLQSLADANNFNKMQTIEPQMPTMNPVAASTTPVTPTIPFYPIAPVTAQTPTAPNPVAPNSVESTTPTANLNHRVDEYDDRDDDDSTENRQKTTNETNAPKTKGYKFIQALLTLTAVCWLPIIFSIVHIALCPNSGGVLLLCISIIAVSIIFYGLYCSKIVQDKFHKECRKCKTPLTADDCIFTTTNIKRERQSRPQGSNSSNKYAIYKTTETFSVKCTCPNCRNEQSFSKKFQTSVEYSDGSEDVQNGEDLLYRHMTSAPIFAKKNQKIIGIVWSAVFAVLTIVVGAVIGAGMNSGTTTKSSGKSVDPCDYYGTYYAYYEGKIATVVINENQFIVNDDAGINNVQRGISEGVDGEYNYKFYTSKDFEKKVGLQSFGYDVLYDNFRRCALYFTSTSHDTITFNPSSSSAPKFTKTPITWESILGTPKTSYFGTYKSSDGSIVKIGLNAAYIDETIYNWFYANGEYVNKHFSGSYSKTKEFFIIYDPENRNPNFVFEIGTNSLKNNNITFEKDTSVDSRIYTVTYYLNGGTNNEDNPTLIDSDTIFTLKNPTKTGYTFDGWYKESTFKTKVTRISSPTGDMSLYAKWSSSSSGGGSTTNTSSLNFVKQYEDGIEYYEVSAKSSTATSLAIPSTYNGLPVCIAADGFYNMTSLKSVVLEDVTSNEMSNKLVATIGASAFYGCKNLSTVTIGNGWAGIDSNAFYGCSSLKSITIPESVYIIDGSAFKNSGLTTATFGYIKNWYAFTEDDLNGNFYTFPSNKLATYLNDETDEYTLAECLTYYYRDKLLINKTKLYETMI